MGALIPVASVAESGRSLAGLAARGELVLAGPGLWRLAASFPLLEPRPALPLCAPPARLLRGHLGSPAQAPRAPGGIFPC